MNAFLDCRNSFKEFAGYSHPLTWEQWKALPTRDAQVAVLYVQFFDQITFAWNKAKADFIPDEDGLSNVLQYVNKNVDKIMEDKSRFSQGYMYRVAYNCMSCLRLVQRDKDRATNETSNVVEMDGEELNLCDLTPHTESYEEKLDRAKFWAIIRDMGPEAEKVANYLVNGESLRRVTKRSAAYGVDPLTDVSVTEGQMEQIVNEMRKRLKGFRAIWY